MIRMGEGKMKLCIISDSYQMICLPYYYLSNTIKMSKLLIRVENFRRGDLSNEYVL